MKRILVILAMCVQAVGMELPLQVDKVSPDYGAVIRNDDSGALIIDLPAYDATLKNTWPGVILSLPVDCSKYDYVEVDLALSGGLAQTISFNFRDMDGGKYYESYNIDDGNRITIRVGLNSQRSNLARMKTLIIYRGRPLLASQFTIYRISLINTLAEKISSLSSGFHKLNNLENAANTEKLSEDCRNGNITLADAAAQYEKLATLLRQSQMEQLRQLNQRRFKHNGFALGVADILEKPLPFAGSFIAELPDTASVELARNEAECLQLVTIAPADKKLENLSISVSDFVCADKQLPAPVTAPVGLVEVKNSRAVSYYRGYYPDPVLEFTHTVTELAPNQSQSWLVRFKTGKDTVPGIYRGFVTLSSKDYKTTLPVEVKVYDFALPERMSLKTATAVYGSKVLGERRDALQEYILVNYHLNGFSIYSDSGSYGEPVLPDLESYRRAAAHGLNFLPIVYLKLPRQAMHTGAGLKPEQSKAAWHKLSPDEQRHYPENWKKKYIEILSKRIPELKAAGLYQFAYCYGFDEATPSEWPAIVELLAELKSHFPDLKVVSTLGDHSYGADNSLGQYLDGWIPGIWVYNYERAQAARARGKEVWYYTTKMTIDRDSLADIRAQLGCMAFANKINGWLVWTVSRWFNNDKPITTAPVTGWNPESYPWTNGGGSYFCMGPNGQFLPTLRAEAIRDGIEDFEYFTILQKAATALPEGNAQKKSANELLESLSRKEGTPIEVMRKQRRDAAMLIIDINKQK